MLDSKLYDPCQLNQIYNQNPQYSKQHLLRFHQRQLSQKQIMTHLLYLMIGMPNELFTADEGKNYKLCKDVEMSHLTPATLKNALKQLVQFANKLFYVQSKLYFLYKSPKPLIKCFCEGIFEYLAEIKDYLASLLSQVQLIQNTNEKKITLLSLWTTVQEKYYSIYFITKCVNVCVLEFGQKGQICRLIDTFYQIQNDVNLHGKLQQALSIRIFSRSLLMYFQTIKKWLKMQKISDDMEFFISNQKQQYQSEYFIHNQTQIQEKKLPNLFKNIVNTILQQGKTIRFISFYYKDYEKKKLLEYFNIDKEFETLQKLLEVSEYRFFKKVKNKRMTINDKLKKVKPKALQKIQVEGDNPYGMFLTLGGNFQYSKIHNKQKQYESEESKSKKLQSNYFLNVMCHFSQILQNLNKKSLKFFKKTENEQFIGESRIRVSLENTLKGIEKFMLCGQGDFFQEFLNEATNILDRPKGRIVQNKVIGYLEQAIKNSSAANLQEDIIQNIHFGFIKKVDEKENKEKMWMSFFFEYKIEDPINYIFTKSMMNSLKSINNFIFCLKKALNVLNNLWDDLRTQSKSMNSGNRIRIFRSSLQSFIESILSHVLNNIDQKWNDFNERIGQVLTVFEIAKQSLNCVQYLRQITIDNKILYNGVIMSFNLIQKFRNIGSLKEYELEKLQFQLKEIVQIILKVPELNERINYNKYYDKID